METAASMPKVEARPQIAKRVEEGMWGKVKEFVSVDRRAEKKLMEYNKLLDTLPPQTSAQERVRIAMRLAKRAQNVAVLGLVMDGLAVGGVAVAAVAGYKLLREGGKRIVHFDKRIPNGVDPISHLLHKAENNSFGAVAIEVARASHDVLAKAITIGAGMLTWPISIMTGKWVHIPSAEKTWRHESAKRRLRDNILPHVRAKYEGVKLSSSFTRGEAMRRATQAALDQFDKSSNLLHARIAFDQELRHMKRGFRENTRLALRNISHRKRR